MTAALRCPTTAGSAWCSRSRGCCPGARSNRTCGSPRPKASDATLAALFRTLGLEAHRDLFPGELSLGLARRVALARAFAVEPDLLLLDEPFVSLDDALAARLRDELAELVTRRPVTTLLVTHNVDEAIGLADRLFFLSASPARVVAEVPIERPREKRTAEELAALRAEIARRASPKPAAPCGGSCRAADRSQRSRAGRTARSSRKRPPSPPARTGRRARSGSFPPHA